MITCWGDEKWTKTRKPTDQKVASFWAELDTSCRSLSFGHLLALLEAARAQLCEVVLHLAVFLAGSAPFLG